MLKFENTEVFGLRAALRGMRNPKNSWEKSDSRFFPGSVPVLGPNDLNLAMRLIKGGTEHRKFLRMIHVQVDITAPYYWIQEFDTYKVGTVRNSCSFMHKGTEKEYTLEDFSFDEDEELNKDDIRQNVLNFLNQYRNKYLETKDIKYFRRIRQLLPAGYNVKFTWDANYEILMNIYRQRKNHRLVEWHQFCDWIETLPYMKDFLKDL